MLTRDISHPVPQVPGNPTPARGQQPCLQNTRLVSPSEVPPFTVSLVATARSVLLSFPAATISSAISVHTRSARQTGTAPFVTHRCPPCCVSTSSSSTPLPCQCVTQSPLLHPIPLPLPNSHISKISGIPYSNQASYQRYHYFHFLLLVNDSHPIIDSPILTIYIIMVTIIF